MTYDQWFRSQQGIPYEGQYLFAEAAWTHQLTRIIDLQTENAALKEQVALLSRRVTKAMQVENIKLREQSMQFAIDLETDRNRVITLKEQVAQQAEAIRLKDAAIAWIQKRCAGEAMPNWENTPHTGHSRGLILDRTNHALAIQPSPEILQSRDEKVAEACCKGSGPESRN